MTLRICEMVFQNSYTSFTFTFTFSSPLVISLIVRCTAKCTYKDYKIYDFMYV